MKAFTFLMIGGLTVSTAVAAEDIKPDPKFDAVLECRAYTVMMPALIDAAAGSRINAYWIERSNKMGAERGLSPEQTEIRALIIPIEEEKAKAVLLRCFDETPKKVIEGR